MFMIDLLKQPLKASLIEASGEYLRDFKPGFPGDGNYHGVEGKVRAEKARGYALKFDDSLAVLALTLAVLTSSSTSLALSIVNKLLPYDHERLKFKTSVFDYDKIETACAKLENLLPSCSHNYPTLDIKKVAASIIIDIKNDLASLEKHKVNVLFDFFKAELSDTQSSALKELPGHEEVPGLEL